VVCYDVGAANAQVLEVQGALNDEAKRWRGIHKVEKYTSTRITE